MSTVFGITAIQFFELFFFIVVIIGAIWGIVRVIVPRFWLGMMRTQKNLQLQTLSSVQQLLEQQKRQQEANP